MKINRISSVFLMLVLVLGTVSTIELYEDTSGTCDEWAKQGYLKEAIKCYEDQEKKKQQIIAYD